MTTAMLDLARGHDGNDSDRSDPSVQDHRSLSDHGRQIHRDATTLATEVRNTAVDVEQYLTDQIEQHPYRTVGAAAGLGYVLGGGLRSRMTALLLHTASRVAMALLAREVGARLATPLTATPPKTSI